MRQTELSLNKRDRRIVDEFRAKGLHMAREFNRAHILAALDSKLPERQIMEVLNVGRTAVWRTRTAYLKGGLDFALRDEPRSGKPKTYEADAEAQVTALACSDPPAGAQRWTVALLTQAARRHPQMKTISRETIRRILKNLLKPWRKLMWCIGELTAEYRRRMYELLELYARPYDPREPVICLDEKCKQLLRETRHALPAKIDTPAKEDYEYERAGTCNIFVAVEPRGQRRIAQVTARRTKVDFVAFVCRMLRSGYSHVRKVHLVLDNLNTHVRESFEEVLGMKTAATLLQRIQFHYTPKHPSWLNMAEIEIGVLQRQCLARCTAEQATLVTEVAAWQKRRNAARCGIEWSFTRRDADRKLSRHYVS